MGCGHYLITSGAQSEENLQLLRRNLDSAAKLSPDPFEIHTKTIVRSQGESVQDYTARLMELRKR